jgi:hypothetical protein
LHSHNPPYHYTAPFRAVRFTLFGFGVAASGLALLSTFPQLIGALAGARNAAPIEEVGINLGVNLGALLLCAFFLKRDLEARDRQMNRLTREEKLGRLTVKLANGKVVPLSQLRGTSRVVIAAGTQAQLSAACEDAEPMKEELIRRGVFLVLCPLFDEEPSSSPSSSLDPPQPEDLRWRATPAQLEEWRAWFRSQQGSRPDVMYSRGLFVGLRLDGRVRSSGQGPPPFPRYLAELAPLTGDKAWSGFFDGFDGRVGG